jgi:hypothetical protein
MHKIHQVIFTLTVSLHVSMDMPSSSVHTKCYRCQRIKKCKFFLHTPNLVYNNAENLKYEQHIDVKISYSFCIKTQ